MNATHWMPKCFAVDEWPENPVTTPEAAARLLLETPTTDSDDSWEAWDELQRSGYVWITVQGWISTTEDPGEDHGMDGYEPGQEWFKKADVARSVMVTLKYDARPEVEE